VGGGGDRQPVRSGVETDLRTDAAIGGEAHVEAVEPGGVEPEVVDALVEHAGRHGPADLVPRQQLVDEAGAVGVAQQGAVAPQRLAEQRAGHGGW
jgi:hypothetical protein